MKRRAIYICTYVAWLTMTASVIVSGVSVVESEVTTPDISTETTEVVDVVETEAPETTVTETTELAVEEITTLETESVTTEPVEEFYIPDEDIRLIALVTMAEAEGQCEEGKRLVIDTILNRVDSPRFPNTVKDVIYAPGQFECMWNGRSDRCYVRDDIYELVKQELRSRTNTEVLYFTSEGFFSWANPLYKVGDHYFSN